MVIDKEILQEVYGGLKESILASEIERLEENQAEAVLALLKAAGLHAEIFDFCSDWSDLVNGNNKAIRKYYLSECLLN